MGRIGKKKKKGAEPSGAQKKSTEAYTKKIGGTSIDAVESRQIGGGFNESDIEFMKKAI